MLALSDRVVDCGSYAQSGAEARCGAPWPAPYLRFVKSTFEHYSVLFIIVYGTVSHCVSLFAIAPVKFHPPSLCPMTYYLNFLVHSFFSHSQQQCSEEKIQTVREFDSKPHAKTTAYLDDIARKSQYAQFV
jgi:hypothetical protein